MVRSEFNFDVCIIAGSSGVGKSTISYPLARHLGMGLTEADDLFLAVQALTTPAEQPEIHYWTANPQAGAQLPPEAVLDIHLSICRKLAPALKSVIDDHIETGLPIVLEGDYILPELVAGYGARVKSVFIVEDDKDQILQNFLSREPGEGPQQNRAEASWLFGQWLRAEAERLVLPVIPARPWDTQLERAIAAVTGE